ncbi:hypothetical protein C0993_001593, partial [Termitomyces sp. T159_Od127]
MVCEFEVPVAGARYDSSVCLSCWSKHKRCFVSRLWRALCVAIEQGWALEWVQGQMEGRSKSWMVIAAGREEGPRLRETKEGSSWSGEESSTSKEEEEAALAPIICVGPPHRKQRPSAMVRGKRQASLSPEVGPSKRPHSDTAMAGPPGLHFFSPMMACPWFPLQESMEQSLLASTMELRRCLQEGYVQVEKEQSELAAVTMDRDWVRQDRDIVLVAVQEQDVELTALRTQVVELELRVVRKVPGEGQAVGAAQVAEQEAVHRWDWALLEAASSRGGVLH